MSGRKFRWVATALLAGGGANLLAIVPTLTAAPALADTDTDVGLVMGGSGTPIPGTEYVDAANDLYIAPNFPDTTYPGVLANGLFTPEGAYPQTGINVLPLSTSVSQGLTILNDNIQSNLAAGDATTVFGYSQSTDISSLEMQLLDPSGTPSDLPVQFVLIGDVDNPNGGLLERFVGLNSTALGLNFDGATPDDSFATSIYSLEYDGFTDFPRYPLNILSDLNAFLGTAVYHGTYLDGGIDGSGPTPEQIADATLLPGSVADGTADSLTNYYMIDEAAPLVSLLPQPLQALLGPDLTYLINLGYGDGSLGYSVTADSPANVPTPIGLFPDVSLSQVLSTLSTDTQQGITAFEAQLADPSTLATSVDPASTGQSFAEVMAALQADAADPSATLTEFVNALSSAASSAYGTLLPTADVVNSLLTSVPAYDLTLFTDSLQAGDLLDAIGLPIAADTALVTFSAGLEVEIIMNALTAISADFAGLL